MASAPIPFGILESGQETLAGAPGAAFNVLLDARGALMRRPGIAAPTNLTTGVVDSEGLIGIYSPKDGVTDPIAVGGGARRNIYRLTASGSVDLSPGSTSSDLLGTERPVFAETEAMVAIAGGEDIQRVFTAQWPATNVPYLSQRLGGSPPRSTHIVANSQRLLSTNRDIQDRVNYSGQSAGDNYSGQETWTEGLGTAGFFSGESDPDRVRAIAQTSREIFVWGANTTEVWAPDPQDIYSPVTAREYGLATPYGVIRVDSAFAWIDHKQRAIMSDGRSFKVISEPIGRELSTISNFTDCFGFRAILGAFDCLVWIWPTDGRSFCYQVGGGWSQWSTWDGAWRRPPINCHALRYDTGDNIVGLTDGRVGVLSVDAFDDMGTTIRAYATSGHQDHGTSNRKHCKRVQLQFARRDFDSTTEAEVQLSYRDDLNEWAAPLRLRFDATDRSPVVNLDSLGIYRLRDWRIEFMGSANMVLSKATETFEVLDN